jgi:HD superfamily phosphodiesterase
MVSTVTTPTNAAQALALLAELGAPTHLVRHHELVVEAAEILVRELRRSFRLRFDVQRVLVGAALHDAGKIKHPSEMRVTGNAHEREGEAMLLARGVAPAVARFCWTHAAWTHPEATLEDLLVAAADKLWRGKREAELEQLLVASIAATSATPAWEAFSRADEIFSLVAADGDDRLERSRV